MISDFQLYVKTRPSALGKSVLGVGPSEILEILELETPFYFRQPCLPCPYFMLTLSYLMALSPLLF